MAKFRLPINNFLLGEVSSKFYGRYDIREISQACRNLLNQFVRPQGGSFRRPGSRFITHQGYGSVTFDSVAKLIPWVISKTESYVLAVVPAASALPDIILYRLSNDTWYQGAEIADSYDHFGINYTAAEIPDIKFKQFGDVMVLTHPSHAPIIIHRMSATTFAYHPSTILINITDPGSSVPTAFPKSNNDGFIVDMVTAPFHSNPTTNHTLRVGATTGSTTLTSNQVFFTSSYVGVRFRIFDAGSGTWGICVVTGFTSTTVVNIDIIAGAPMGSTVATANWQEMSWSDARGWPRSAAFHQNRLDYAGTTSFPNNIWFSENDDIYELARPPVGANDNHAFTGTLRTGELNAIQWICSGKTLIAGTIGQELIITGTDPNEAINNSNFQANPETGYGSEYVNPVRVDNALLFVQRTGQKIREFQFNFNEDAYNSRDLNRYADHIGLKAYDYYSSVTVPKFIEIAYQSGDNPMVWALDNNGVLNALMRDKESTAIAWSPVKLGGKFGSGSEPPVVLSMCVVPSYSGLDDELWLYVKRTVNSSTVYFMERITREFFGDDLDQASAPNSHFYPYYLDCAINQTLGAPGVTFNGFARLNGETVNVIADGNYIGTKTVTANTITLASNYTTVTAGYTYQSIVSPILPDVGSVIGTAIGAVRRVHDIAIRFRRTVAAKFGRSTSASDYEEITFRSTSDSLLDPIPLFDGIKRRNFNGEYDRDPQIYIFQDDPLPMEVTSFGAEGVTYD